MFDVLQVGRSRNYLYGLGWQEPEVPPSADGSCFATTEVAPADHQPVIEVPPEQGPEVGSYFGSWFGRDPTGVFT